MLRIIVCSLMLAFLSCQKPSNPIAGLQVNTQDFTTTIEENPKVNQLLGKVLGQVNIDLGTPPRFSILNCDPPGALFVDEINGDLLVHNTDIFDYEKNDTITASFVLTLVETSDTSKIMVVIEDVFEDSFLLQQKLYKGENPFDLIKSKAFNSRSFIGLKYKGGLIYYIDTINNFGLIAARIDNPKLPWACNYPNGDLQDMVETGEENTTKVYNYCSDLNENAISYCHKLDHNGFQDWFLPSIDELEIMYDELLWKGGYTAFNQQDYWSSSQENEKRAKTIGFFNTKPIYHQSNGIVDNSRAVRIFRK